MNETDLLSPVPKDFKWPRCPEAEEFLRENIQKFLKGHAFARDLSHRMLKETSTDIFVWVDHIIIPEKDFKVDWLKRLGFVLDSHPAPEGYKPLWHPFADLPKILLRSHGNELSMALMVESVSDFLLAHSFNVPIKGAPFSSYRSASIPGPTGNLTVVERRGGRAFQPDYHDRAAAYNLHLEEWALRRRVFSTVEEGMNETLKKAQRVAAGIGKDAAGWIFLEGERRYWQKRNRAARVQKARQDVLGLGWANHDHHTFRSSRSAFPTLIEILKTFGFKKRERFYAGAEAGWGAQVMEHPGSKLIIFADVDLTPQDAAVDFSVQALPDLEKPGTVGLWCALHGESMLQAGMHHLEAKFDFDQLKRDLIRDNVKTMNPFSDFPHLRQAFTEGEMWQVPVERLEALFSQGKISEEGFKRFKEQGAVGSHLENLQRKDGFKGFNQRGVSDIIREVNPEKQALKQRKAS